jgi:hypothetical protein
MNVVRYTNERVFTVFSHNSFNRQFARLKNGQFGIVLGGFAVERPPDVGGGVASSSAPQNEFLAD